MPAFVGTSIFGTSKFLCLRQPKTTKAEERTRPLGVQVQLVLDGLEHLVPGHLELGHALVLEDLDHVVVADAEPLEVGEDLAGRVVGAVHRVAREHAVVGGRVQGRLGHRVHRVGDDQVDDVHGVGEGRVLGGGGRPQRPLHLGALGGEGPPPVGVELLLVELVGEPRVGDGRLALQRQRLRRPDRGQPLVDLGVDPGDEERRDRRDRGDVVPVGRRLLEPGHVGVDDLAVAGEGEDQRHVDRDPLGQRRGDRGDALGRGRDLDVHVRPVDQPPQLLGLGDRRARSCARAAGRPRSTPARRRRWRRRRPPRSTSAAQRMS